jgi:hypothetical protein
MSAHERPLPVHHKNINADRPRNVMLLNFNPILRSRTTKVLLSAMSCALAIYCGFSTLFEDSSFLLRSRAAAIALNPFFALM